MKNVYILTVVAVKNKSMLQMVSYNKNKSQITSNN